MRPEDVCRCFNACFADPAPRPVDRARMEAGGDDPLYLAPTAERPWGVIRYARGLAQSCLHEAAHWCIAGRRRRARDDYGYWYEPDGRSVAQQAAFEAVEDRTQGIEWLFAAVAGIDFVISADNLARPDPSPAFVAAITRQATRALAGDIPPRARCFAEALQARTRRVWPTRVPALG